MTHIGGMGQAVEAGSEAMRSSSDARHGAGTNSDNGVRRAELHSAMMVESGDSSTSSDNPTRWRMRWGRKEGDAVARITEDSASARSVPGAII